jgi:hypothetical protein
LAITKPFLKLFLFHDGIPAITEPFTIFSSSRWNFGYQGAFHTNFSFSRWNSGYQGALFARTFLFHDGISAITELFTIFYFSRRNSGYQGAFHTVTFTKCTNWGKTLFIYVTKSIYTGSALIKTLPFDLEPPLQGKEYGPSYSNEIAKRKGNFLFSKSLIDS